MSATQAEVDALNQAIRDGVRSVQIGGQTVIYQTTESLIKARDDAVTALTRAQNQGSAKPVSRETYLYYGGRGL